jgi:hypothetical protein
VSRPRRKPPPTTRCTVPCKSTLLDSFLLRTPKHYSSRFRRRLTSRIVTSTPCPDHNHHPKPSPVSRTCL